MRIGDFIWGLVLVGITALLVVPATHAHFISATMAHPYLMGFAKFAVLASMGELLALRILAGRWGIPKGFAAKAFVWGIIGILVVLMFGLFLEGTKAVMAKGLLPAGSGGLAIFLLAFYTAFIMDYTFGIVFMALHRISDTWIDTKAETGKAVSIGQIVEKTDWKGFINFVVGKTIPYFWLPAHTITFLLPPAYRVLAAAYLGIALGIILAYARKKGSQPAH